MSAALTLTDLQALLQNVLLVTLLHQERMLVSFCHQGKPNSED